MHYTTFFQARSSPFVAMTFLYQSKDFFFLPLYIHSLPLSSEARTILLLSDLITFKAGLLEVENRHTAAALPAAVHVPLHSHLRIQPGENLMPSFLPAGKAMCIVQSKHKKNRHIRTLIHQPMLNAKIVSLACRSSHKSLNSKGYINK